MPEGFATVREAMEALGVSRAAIIQAIGKGGFPGAIRYQLPYGQRWIWLIPASEVTGYEVNERLKKNGECHKPRRSTNQGE